MTFALPLPRWRPSCGQWLAIECLALLTALCCCGSVEAWEGHDWKEWRRVATWQQPDLHTAQSGRPDLAAVLGKSADGAPVITTVRGWEEERRQLAFVIQRILGTPSNLTAPPLEVRELGRESLNGYSRRHLMIRSEPDDWIAAYLLVPDTLAAPRVPAMLCLHQTVAQGKQEPCGIQGDPELAFALELVKRGYVCLAPDVIGFGERIPAGKQPYHDSLAFYRKHPGWSFMGKMVWDVRRSIDYLETLEFVDSRRIGSIGHSHGAYGTLFAAAFEPRITAAVASCGFTTFRSDPNPERWSHLTALIPQLGAYLPEVSSIPFDWQHLLALIAPRGLFVWYATQDTIFPRTENLEGLLRDVRGVDALYGQGEALAWQSFDGPHRFPQAGREAAYRWLDGRLSRVVGLSSKPASNPNAVGDPARPEQPQLKVASAFFPGTLVARARRNAQAHAWASDAQAALVAAAKPWLDRSDDELWALMFGNTIRRAWQVWSDGYCPACRQPVPMYEWNPDALRRPWTMQCPRCKELFPKNDFQKFLCSGLDAQGVFDPQRADRSLLFNTEHPDPADALHRFGVDDGEGCVAEGKRWRFIGAYLIFGQWKQAIVNGIRNLAAAYVATGEPAYAHKAGVLLDRVADLYPTFDFGKEGVMYEGPPRAGYVSTWHDACVEVQELALAYDAVFEGLARDGDLVKFLAAKAAHYHLDNSKASFGDIQRNIEERIFRDTLEHRSKIESNYPSTDITIATLHTVLGWPGKRAEVLAMLDAIIGKATAVDGVTGEKGIAGYSVIAPRIIAELLGRYARSEPGFLREIVRRHPRVRDLYRFHLDTWCLGQYYPRTGDTGSFAERNPGYPGLAFSRSAGVNPSAFTFLWELYEATGDKDFVRLLYGANGASAAGLPYDLFAPDPGGFQASVQQIINQNGADIRLASVNKQEWGLAILRSGEGPHQRAAWLDYDSGERHGHADGMTLGLFARGLDLLPDFGYPPVQYGGWTSPRALWYTQTAAHNTVLVDGQNTRPGTGKVTLWFDGAQFHTVGSSGPRLIGGARFDRTITLVDSSDQDFYVLDVFRVSGGREHTQSFHGSFGELSTERLSLTAAAPATTNLTMRGFRRDPAPVEGWWADWRVEDRFHYLPAGAQVHLRLTDLTRGAEVETAETWVSVAGFGGTAEAWIPSVLVRRRATQAPLASTFISLLEPHDGAPKVVSARRLDLRDGEGNPPPEDCVGLEVRLVDGRRDVLLSAGTKEPGEFATILEPATGLRFEGELCLVRFAAAGRPVRVALARGRSLALDGLRVVVKTAGASLELDLANPTRPVVAGPPDALERIEIGGTTVVPK
jgi:dienelactone hydrolase